MTLHFAYGSNMSRALMIPRCPGAVEIGRAVLAGYRFFISADGYASIAPQPGGVVHGLVWRLTPRDRAALDDYEGLDTGLYRAVVLPVQTGTRRVRAMVYVGRSRAPGRPRPGYLALILSAAREIGLPSAYVQSLARTPSRDAGRLGQGDLA